MNRMESDRFAQLIRYVRAYRPKAQRYNAGEFSQFGQLPMWETALEQLLQWQPAAIQAYCSLLSQTAIPSWEAMGCRLEAPEYRAGHLFGLQLPDHIDTAALLRRLADQRIYVSLRGGALRVSPNVYNHPADLVRLIEEMHKP